MKTRKAQFRETLPKMQEVMKWAERQDISGLRSFLLSEGSRPLIGVSSGGASSPLVYACMLYGTYQGLGRAVTPLSFSSLSDATLRNSKILILSNSGHGVDPDYTSRRAFKTNPEWTACLTKPGENNDLMKRAEKDDIKCFAYDWPEYGLKGFVSALSNIATMALIYKAFTNDAHFCSQLKFSIKPEENYSYHLLGDFNGKGADATVCEPKSFSYYKHYIVLYGGYGEAVATDIETKFVECGYASVQACDYRNFCHGRFIFESNNFDDTCIVLLRTPRERLFSEDLIIHGHGIHKDKTTGSYHLLFPEDMPIVTIDTDLDEPLAALDLEMKAQVFFTDAGESYGYDPFNPNNPKNIDKRALRSKPFKGIGKIALNNR